jgi:hypothetical protein
MIVYEKAEEVYLRAEQVDLIGVLYYETVEGGFWKRNCDYFWNNSKLDCCQDFFEANCVNAVPYERLLQEIIVSF